ncbi:MAG: acyl carrier protein [Actinobacteria bacterium QS_5_72_10]|jgi:acyl carrier protein|nr:MAG: acyl carrier protein [Actinobacteria bacterium QS_5_72_10]
MSARGREEIAELVTTRLGEVLAIDSSDVCHTARFEEDLAADSLDRLEVLEGVESDLRAQGLAVSLPDAELTSLRTVCDAVDRIHAQVTQQGRS